MKTIQELLDDRYRELADRSDGPNPVKKIAVISTPRTGSSLFCEQLTQTGVFGFAAEWFNPAYVKAYGRVFGHSEVDLEAYCDFIIRKTTTSNGVFSVNFHIRQYIHQKKNGFNILNLEFDQIFRVYRRDRFAQALSLLKARGTQRWSSEVKATNLLDVEECLNSEILSLVVDISLWDEYFKDHLLKFTNCEFEYEKFHNNNMFVSEILDICGINYTTLTQQKSRLTRQSSAIDATHLKRLKKYVGCSE